MDTLVSFFQSSPFWLLFAGAGVVLGFVVDFLGLRSKILRTGSPTAPTQAPASLDHLRAVALASVGVAAGVAAAEAIAHHADTLESLGDVAEDLVDIGGATSPVGEHASQGIVDDLLDAIDPS